MRLTAAEGRRMVRLRRLPRTAVARGLLYFTTARNDWRQQEHRQVRVDVGASASEVVSDRPLIRNLAVRWICLSFCKYPPGTDLDSLDRARDGLAQVSCAVALCCRDRRLRPPPPGYRSYVEMSSSLSASWLTAI